MLHRSCLALSLVAMLVLMVSCTGDDSSSTPTPDESASTATAVAATATPVPIAVQPGDQIQAIVDQAPAGAHFVLAAGVYREQQIAPRDGDIFEGEPGAVLNGARVLDGFTRDGAVWWIDGQTQRGEAAGSCATPDALADIEDYRGCRFPEQLFFDDEPLWQVTSLDELAPGRWYFDYDAGRIYVVDDPTSAAVEASTTVAAFISTASDVTIRGLVVEKYSNPTQTGAIQAAGASGWIVEDNEIRLNHSYGLRIGPEMLVRNNNVHHNGHLGIGGIGSDALIEGNEIAYNHTGGFSEEWEAGGLKIVLSDGVVIRDNWVHHNQGRGLWSDIDVINLVIADNLVEWNSRAGITHEIGHSARIINNIARNNGLGFDVWLWGAQILVQNSSDVEVSGNQVTVSASGGNGITIVNQDRGSGDRGPYVSNRVSITGNTIRQLGFRGYNGSHDCNPDTENLFDGNRYEASSTWYSQPQFMWCDLLTFEEFQAAGQEPNGTTAEF